MLRYLYLTSIAALQQLNLDLLLPHLRQLAAHSLLHLVEH
uniref:Uncharacterized protein n=1 Tax=Rheinheimera sp. BAL341 TaxID=1708203 RepID=A0A486XIQ0_9GAMM